MKIIKKFWQFVKNTSHISLCAIFLAIFFYLSIFISSIFCAFLIEIFLLLFAFKKISPKIIICVIFSSFLCIFSLFNFKNMQKPIISLIETEKITNIYGVCVNSPSKTQNGTYFVTLKCFAVSGNLGKNKVFCSAKGFVNVILPQNIVENYYPGKIGKNIQNTNSQNENFNTLQKTNAKNAPNFQTENKNSSEIDKLLIDKGLAISVLGEFNKSNAQYFYVKNAQIVNYSIIKTYAKPKHLFFQNKFLNAFYKIRAILRIKLKKLLFAFGKAGAFLLALFCGSKEYLDPFLKENFSRSGVSHILALSGLHLSLVALGAKKGASLFLGAKRSAFLILLLVFGFVLFASSSPSLTRAFIFVFFSILAKKLCIKAILTKLLSFSFIVQLIFNAPQAKNAAFLLSYSAMLGIALILPLFEKKISKMPKLWAKPLTLLATCFSAQCGTFILTLIFFKTFSPFGILASFLLIPLVSVFLYLGVFCTILASIFPFLIPFLHPILNFFYHLIEIIAQFFAKMPCFYI